MPKPKLYDKRETLRMDTEMDTWIEAWRPLVGLRRGEGVRRLIQSGMRYEELKARDKLLSGTRWTPEEQAKIGKADPQPVNKILAREQSEALKLKVQRGMGKKK